MVIANIIFEIISMLCAVFCWYRIGRQWAYSDLLEHYQDACDVIGRLSVTLEAYRAIYGEIEDGETN